MTAKLVSNDVLSVATLTCTKVKSGLLNNIKNPFKTSVVVLNNNLGFVDINVSFTSPQMIGAVIIPASTLSASSSVQVVNIVTPNGATPNEQEKFGMSGTVLSNWDFSQSLNDSLNIVNTAIVKETPPVFAYYFSDNKNVNSFTIRIKDTSSEFAICRLVVGEVLNFETNADYSSAVSFENTASHKRASSSDLRTDSGISSKTMQINMNWVLPSDREKLIKLFNINRSSNIFVSLLPDDIDPSLERQFSIYGRLDTAGDFGLSDYGVQSTSWKIIGY